MTPKLGIEEDNRTAVVGVLNALLSDEYVLYTKTRNFHWNVTGPTFRELHAFFEEQYRLLDESVDAVAERARNLGGDAVGTLEEFLELSRLEEAPADSSLPANKMLASLLSDHEKVIRQLREDIKACEETYDDQGTMDFLTGLMEDHEKMAWMLRAHLES
ncbi:MAG TPA: DNA starvation/stationary phase protection protein [Candidatus Polarisedimenticolaceae bacterium]|nr:DNA starvation/stationary phase protection protein [Candidatus Polarisedimenticolaceae bacterium]